MHRQGGVIAINIAVDYYSEDEYLTEQKKRKETQCAYNFVRTEGRFIPFNTRAEDGYKAVKNGQPNYDPDITKQVIRKMDVILKD
jgi:hypothetical protein